MKNFVKHECRRENNQIFRFLIIILEFKIIVTIVRILRKNYYCYCYWRRKLA